MLAALVATASGLRMGRGAKTADGSGLASAGRSPDILMLKNRAAERTQYMILAIFYHVNDRRYVRSASD